MLKEDLIDGLSSAFSCNERTCSAGGKIGGCLPPPNLITFESSESGSITPGNFLCSSTIERERTTGFNFESGKGTHPETGYPYKKR